MAIKKRRMSEKPKYPQNNSFLNIPVTGNTLHFNLTPTGLKLMLYLQIYWMEYDDSLQNTAVQNYSKQSYLTHCRINLSSARKLFQSIGLNVSTSK